MRRRTWLAPWFAASTCGLLLGVAHGGASAESSRGQSDTLSFEASIEPINDALAAEMRGVSWHPRCPVGIPDLRLIRLTHWGFDGELHRGELVVHADVATDIVGVFSQLFDARFPILRMERVEVYHGDDDASMAANNTSAFNCREITGGGAFSVHSYGKAVDINPVENPYVKGEIVLPPAGAAFLDRTDVRPGMIVERDVVVEAFADIGFIWGGNWDRLKDFQHFEAEDPTAGIDADATDEPPEIPETTAMRACAAQPPNSDGWTVNQRDFVDTESGELDPTPFNAFLATAGPPISTSPCDAARVLLHVDQPLQDGETVVVVVEPEGVADATVTVTFEQLADDSSEAVQYVLRFEDHGDGTIRLASGTWSQRCQPGRGHQDFSTELCG